jgi:hypothetical protein
MRWETNKADDRVICVGETQPGGEAPQGDCTPVGDKRHLRTMAGKAYAEGPHCCAAPTDTNTQWLAKRMQRGCTAVRPQPAPVCNGWQSECRGGALLCGPNRHQCAMAGKANAEGPHCYAGPTAGERTMRAPFRTPIRAALHSPNPMAPTMMTVWGTVHATAALPRDLTRYRGGSL